MKDLESHARLLAGLSVAELHEHATCVLTIQRELSALDRACAGQLGEQKRNRLQAIDERVRMLWSEYQRRWPATCRQEFDRVRQAARETPVPEVPDERPSETAERE